MTRTRETKGYVKIVARKGCVILDTRNNKEYSEVICKEGNLVFFIEVGQ